MALPAESQTRIPSQENLLLDYVRRLENHKEGRKVVHVHLSKLRSFNRRDQHIRTAASTFEPLVKELQGQLFTLKNADLFFIYKSEQQHQVETMVQKIKFLFSDDPLIEEESKDNPFSSWYDAELNFDDIIQLVQGLADVEKVKSKPNSNMRARMDTRASLKAKQEMGEPLTPDVLGRVEDALSRADLSNLVRRQIVCALDEKMVPEPEFSELFISITDLRETLIPGVNLLANRWLFQHLTVTLDRRMLAMLTKTDSLTISGNISFNINVATILSDDFQNFDNNITAARRGNLILEVQKEDIFTDLGAFLFAREFVQAKGYRVCLDGMTHEAMEMLDRERLGTDMVKLIWHPEMADGGEDVQNRVRRLVEHTKPENVVMCRVDNREAIDYGQTVGINLFQGRHIENLIAEDTRRRELLRLKRRIERSGDGEEFDDGEEMIE
jgi:EAL domain-containing protein (putative c-di-GMP-specific phosphodiesterase class I)